MNKYILIVIAVVVLAKVGVEYNALKASLSDVKTKAMESLTVAEDARKTLNVLTQTIQDLRQRILRAEAENAELMARLDMPKAEQPKVEGAKVVMHSGANCEPCQKWKREQMPQWKAKGWDVQVVEETESDTPWPWFEVCENGKCYKVVGPLTADTLKKAKQ